MPLYINNIYQVTCDFMHWAVQSLSQIKDNFRTQESILSHKNQCIYLKHNSVIPNNTGTYRPVILAGIWLESELCNRMEEEKPKTYKRRHCVALVEL